MQDEITVRPLVDILSEQLGEQVVMSGDKYVYLDTKAEVMQSEVELAMISQAAELLEQANAKTLSEQKAYLKSTDWITAKYNDEVTVLGNILKEDFIVKYQSVYDARQNARNEINRLESQLEE